MTLNKQNIFASTILIYLVSYDFLFYQLEEIFSINFIILKTYFEVLFFGALISYFVYVTKFSKLHSSVLFLLSLVFCCVVYAFIINEDIISVIKDFRLFFLPITICFLLYFLNAFDLINIKKLLWFYILLSFLLILYGFFEYIIFDGSLKSVWRYEYLLELKKEVDPNYQEHKIIYQIIRDGSIRVSSIFISALDYSFYVATFGILIFIMILKLKNIYLLPLFLITIFSLYISQVRTGFILLSIGIICYFLLNSKIKIVNRLAFFIPFVAIFGTFFLMLTESSVNDSSSLGRLVQYYELISKFTIFGSGMGKYAFDFDSLYIYIFLTYGVLGILFFYLQYWIINKLLFVYRNHKYLNGYEKVMLQFMIIYHLSSLYLFAFQHTLGAPTFFILYFFSFIILTRTEYSIQKKKYCE